MALSNEKHKALAMLVLSSMPLLLEMHGDISTFVDWHIIIPIVLYTMFVFKLSQNDPSNDDTTHAIFVCCAKSTLCTTVFFAWMSLFFNLHIVLVKCLMVQSEGSPDLHLTQCRHNGIVTECLETLSLVNRIHLMSEKCPSSVLGPSLGTVYLFMIVLLRFIPTGIYGLWKLYVWDPRQFEQKNEYISEIHTAQYFTPNTKILLGCTIALLPCIMTSAALQDTIQLIHFTTAIPFLTIIIIHYNLRKSDHSKDANTALHQLMRTCVYVSIIYSITDFVINGLTIIKQCLGPEIQREETIQQCNGFEWSSGIERCYEKLSDIDATFFPDSRCPKMGDPITISLYIANTLQLCLLTIGVLLAFIIQKPTERCNE